MAAISPISGSGLKRCRFHSGTACADSACIRWPRRWRWPPVIAIGQRMDFDTEIMVRLYWAGTPSRFIATRVTYPQDGVSHFDALHDNLRISWMHTRLFFGMLPRIPSLLRRHAWRALGATKERKGLCGHRFMLCDLTAFLVGGHLYAVALAGHRALLAQRRREQRAGFTQWLRTLSGLPNVRKISLAAPAQQLSPFPALWRGDAG